MGGPSGGGASTPLPNLTIPLLLFKLPQTSPRPTSFNSPRRPSLSTPPFKLHPPLSTHIPISPREQLFPWSGLPRFLFHHGANSRRDGHRLERPRCKAGNSGSTARGSSWWGWSQVKNAFTVDANDIDGPARCR
jgi:hypothetical protein